MLWNIENTSSGSINLKEEMLISAMQLGIFRDFKEINNFIFKKLIFSWNPNTIKLDELPIEVINTISSFSMPMERFVSQFYSNLK